MRVQDGSRAGTGNLAVNVNKAQLVEALATHFDGDKVEAARALDAVVQTIIYSTALGERVTVTGFGTFEKVARPARIVRDPRTGEGRRVKASAVPQFRAGAELKAYVSGTKKVPRAARRKILGPPAKRSVQTS